jgi:hypothetical protein
MIGRENSQNKYNFAENNVVQAYHCLSVVDTFMVEYNVA